MQHYPHKKEQSIFQVKIKRTLDIVQEEIWPNILWKVLTYRVWHKFFTFNNKKFSILNQSRWYSGNWIIRFYPKKMCLIPKYATLHCLSILFLLHMIWCLVSFRKMILNPLKDFLVFVVKFFSYPVCKKSLDKLIKVLT